MFDILENYIARDAAAAALKCTARTLANYENQVDGLPVTKIAGRVYYRKEALVAFIAGRERQANPTQKRRRA